MNHHILIKIFWCLLAFIILIGVVHSFPEIVLALALLISALVHASERLRETLVDQILKDK